MSKMKHLLRKLHIGNYNHHHRRMVVNEASPQSDSVSSESRAVDSSSSDRTVENERSRTNPRDFNFFEEEFQVQLALAISASDPEPQNDVELDQIKAAKQLSLGCSPSVPDNERLSEFLSLKYWNYNFIHYDEKIVDGFYDVYAIASNSIAQGEMPLFMDLQAISISSNMEYEVISVNRSVDFQLQHLENKAYAISVECKVLGCGLFLNSLIRRIADLVVDKMGGPVVNAEEMMKKWRVRSDELKTSLNTIILPLGCLDVGLSRHRALLFKVLADRINLPCTLVKGSLYTGIDDGAVNLIKIDGGEYIIDLMGAPGALVPAEIPSSLLLDAALEARDFPGSSATINNLSLVLDKVSGIHRIVPDSVEVPTESTMAEIQSTQDSEIFVWEKTKRSEQERKVKDVSEYVISAAKDPQFAQKLHAVLLESGATPPADLFLDMNPDILGEEKLIAPVQHVKRDIVDYVTSCCPETNWTEIMFGYDPEGAIQEPSREKSQLGTDLIYSHLLMETENKVVAFAPAETRKMTVDDGTVESSNKESGFEDYEEHSMKNLNNDRGCETVKRSCVIACNGSDESVEPDASEKISPMLGEVAEWDIPWDDLQIGERIGIGSYGEVYRADWNGTEVAVKKFLVQDLTGDVLLQFKCEAEMMIRLRHPNVVLFMGAVTRPPNLSILTEFLPRGSLYKLLHRSSTCIDERRRMKMALDVARGMNYLHTGHPPIVHRDLKTPNLLVDKNWGVKVCDFGLSRLKHHTFLSSKSTAGTPEWMAPEVLRNEPSNEKSDVYSFGVILWELATLCMPWSGLNPMQVVGAVGFQNRRLDIPEEVDPMVAQIIRDCWENDPSLRPSFSEIMSRLKVLDRLIVPIN